METDGLELKNTENKDINATSLKIQKPKKVLHFSDGVMEEYSDSEDEFDSVTKNPVECINTKDLPWAPYFRLKANKMGSSVLAGIDYVGGGLASMLGITPSEADLAAAKRGMDAQENTDEEQCGTWNPARNDQVVSVEVKSSQRGNSN